MRRTEQPRSHRDPAPNLDTDGNTVAHDHSVTNAFAHPDAQPNADSLPDPYPIHSADGGC